MLTVMQSELEVLGSVHDIEQGDYEKAANEHRDGAKEPQKQRKREIVASEPKGKEIGASVYHSIHILCRESRGHFSDWNCDEEADMARIPDCLHAFKMKVGMRLGTGLRKQHRWHHCELQCVLQT